MTTQAAGGVPEWRIGDRLRRARETTGKTIQEFAEQIGVDRKTASAAESGAKTPRAITIKAYALRTGVPEAWLRTGDAPTSPGPDGGGERNGLDPRHARTGVLLHCLAVAA